MKTLIRPPFALMLFSAASVAWAQASPSAEAASAASTTAAAPAAAKPLFAVEFRTGATWNAALPPGQQAFMREHSANLKKLRDEGRIRIGARYGEVGLVVLEAASIDEARAWIEADPAVKAGTFRYTINPFGVFYGGTLQR
jgi:uncharacterized protein YciI